MRFQRTLGGKRLTGEAVLHPRSAYVLAGEARFAWQHLIPPTKELRYSITFRTLKEAQPADLDTTGRPVQRLSERSGV